MAIHLARLWWMMVCRRFFAVGVWGATEVPARIAEVATPQRAPESATALQGRLGCHFPDDRAEHSGIYERALFPAAGIQFAAFRAL